MSHAFWDWSLDRYEQPGVASACLDLQDRQGLNVNICLWCCWLAEEGRDARPALAKATAALEPWTTEITRAIRETRRKLKDQAQAGTLYKAILACELDAEHVEQDILFELAADLPESGATDEDTATMALAEYTRIQGVETDCAPLLKAVFSARKNV